MNTHLKNYVGLLLAASSTCYPSNDYFAHVETTYSIPPSSSTYSYEDHIERGKKLVETNSLDQALAAFEQALALWPTANSDGRELANCFLNLGNCYFGNAQGEKALRAFTDILTISDKFSAVHHNIGFTQVERCGQFSESINAFKKALAINPHNPETHFCLALGYLGSGDLLHGFKEYEWRWQRAHNKPRAINYPCDHLWDGTQEIEGKRILIRCEQGLGDTLHFIRYAQELKREGAIVMAEVQKSLAQLLALCDYIDELIVMGNPLPTYDFQIPMLNLPLAFGTTLEIIPDDIPYLRADPRLVAFWRDQLSSAHDFKVGICWYGDPAHGQNKFMPLSYFAQLTEIPGVQLYNLQKIDSPAVEQQLKDLPDQSILHFFGPDFDESHGRFMDTAAVMKSLDLIITVDTSLAHLAGGLGVPTWLVLPFPAEWRWLSPNDQPDWVEQSPWYPTMRLFRQTTIGDWKPVLENIKKEIENLT